MIQLYFFIQQKRKDFMAIDWTIEGHMFTLYNGTNQLGTWTKAEDI
jgi:hypothetical protein